MVVVVVAAGVVVLVVVAEINHTNVQFSVLSKQTMSKLHVRYMPRPHLLSRSIQRDNLFAAVNSQF